MKDRSPEPPTYPADVQEPAMSSYPIDMDAWAWNVRPLVVFARSAEQSNLAEQRLGLISHQAGLDDRQMLVVEIVGHAVTVNGEARTADIAELKERFDIDADAEFAVRLVGKDTGIKLRRAKPVAMDELFGLIDSMPMRQREMGEASP